MKIQYPPVFRASFTTCSDVSVSARTIYYCSFSNCLNINLNCDVIYSCTITKTIDTTNTNNTSYYYITANHYLASNTFEGLGIIKLKCNSFSINNVRNIKYLDLDANIVSGNKFTYTTIAYVSGGANTTSTFYISNLNCKCYSVYYNTFENINCLNLNCYTIFNNNFNSITNLNINCNVLSYFEISSIKNLNINCNIITNVTITSCMLCNITAPYLRYCRFSSCSIIHMNCDAYYDNSMYSIRMVSKTVFDDDANTYNSINFLKQLGYYVTNMSCNSINWLEVTAHEVHNITHNNVTNFYSSLYPH